ncbi:MAG: porin family protein [Calditrichaeota bacterium]|nr:porin family protein [Calditrichota bacterium]
MRKFASILCIALLLLAAGGANATLTRVITLGESNHLIQDEANIWVWPQALMNFPNLGAIDIIGASINTAGVHYEMEGHYLGYYWTTDLLGNAYLPSYFGGGLDQKITLFYARELATMPFGIGFSLYGNSHETDMTADKSAHSGLGLGISAGMTFAEALETFFAFNMLTWEEKNTAGTVINETEGGTDISLGLRYWYEFNEKMTLIPYFGLTFGSTGEKHPGGKTSESLFSLTLGLGDDMKFSEKMLFVEDIGFQMNNYSRENGVKADSSVWLMPYFRAGMEVAVSEKFTFRFGGVKEWEAVDVESGGQKESWGNVNTRFYLGAAFKRGPFSIDLNVDPGILTRGPYLITGAPGPWASMVSLRYVWGE